MCGMVNKFAALQFLQERFPFSFNKFAALIYSIKFDEFKKKQKWIGMDSCGQINLIRFKTNKQNSNPLILRSPNFMRSPSQLFSCVDSAQILRSPINTSPSKLQWSFSKSDRFPDKKLYCDSFYNIPGMETNDGRKAGMGKGKKTDLDYGKHPHQEAPSPDVYQIASFVDINKAHNKGFTPRNSRQEVAPMSYIGFPYKYNTGPGRYDEFRFNQSPKWTVRPRVSSQIFPQTTQKIVPGPGQYTGNQPLDNVGRYNLSNHRNSKSKIWNPPRSKRFIQSSTFVPGSGAYTPNNDLSNEGKYVLSKNQSAGKRKFMLGRRESFTDFEARRSQTPGPGSYRLQSDFGHYDELRTSTSKGGDMIKTGRTTSTSFNKRS